MNVPLSRDSTTNPMNGCVPLVENPQYLGIEWDAENRLLAVKQGSTTLASFTYDGRGLRATKTAGGIQSTYLYERSHVVEERKSVGGTVRYFFGIGTDDVQAKQDSSGAFYYVKDHLGSVRQVTNASGDVVVSRDYDPWGRLLSGSSEPAFSFTGREWDPEAQLYYYRARYYDPGIARFISEDPMRIIAGVNSYIYVGNNPAAFTDPSGLLRVNINRQVYRSGWPGTGNMFARITGVTPKCEEDCGNWKLTFQVDVQIILDIGSVCPGFIERHEKMHASAYLGELERALAPLKTAERKTYSSSQQCYEAAEQAMAQLAATNPATLRKHNRVIDTYIPCVWQFGR